MGAHYTWECIIHGKILIYYGHLFCFQVWAIINNAAISIGMPIFFLISVSGFLGYIPTNGITRSNSNKWQGCGERENPSALLVGMQTGTTTVEGSTEFPQKLKIKLL